MESASISYADLRRIPSLPDIESAPISYANLRRIPSLPDGISFHFVQYAD